LKILIATHYWAPHKGGIEAMAYEQARRLVSWGHEVAVVTSRLMGDPPYQICDGIHVHRVRAINPLERKGVPYPLFAPALLTRVFRLVRQADIVLAHSHTFQASVVASLVSRWANKPFVILQHNTYVNYKPPWNIVESLADLLLGRMTLWSARRVLAISRETKHYIERLACDKPVIVLHNGVDTKRFRPVQDQEKADIRKKFGLPPDKFLVLTVRRLVYRNGVDTLVQAAAELRENSSFHFLIGGTGPDTALLERLINNQGLTNCTLLGFVEDGLLPEYYSASDVFVLPSRTGEGFGLVVLEAFASGLPVVATSAGGQTDIVLDQETGFLVAPDSPGEIAAALTRCNLDRDLYLKMSRKAMALAESLDWDKQTGLLLKHLRETWDLFSRDKSTLDITH
jgi:glycosyltransferase involved in cell wall biosynthesis